MTQREDFFQAVTDGDRHRVARMLERAPSLSHATDPEGRTGLLLAVYHGHHELVNLLTRHRPSVDVFEAAASGDAARVLELVREEPARAGYTSQDGFSPLGLGAFFGHPEVVAVLLDAGADPNVPSRNAMKVTPLHSGAACSDPSKALAICRALLGAGADPNVRQAGGWTPLHQAASHGNGRLASLLLDRGADAAAASEDGRTPVEMARSQGHDEVVERLEDEAGAPS